MSPVGLATAPIGRWEAARGCLLSGRHADRKSLGPGPVQDQARSIVTTLVSGTTRFVGRDRDLAVVRRLMGSTRLVTLTGPGGVGKSRLAARVLDQWPDDVWQVDLSEVVDVSGMVHEMTHRLGIRPSSGAGDRPTRSLIDFFADRDGLLVLDNCDRALAACRELVPELLRACPALRIIVTSRQSVGTAHEAVVGLDPLTVPEPGIDVTVESAGRSESVQLFVDRAASVAPGFTLTDDNVAAVARLCVALDGLALAVELAAARIRELSPEAMLERLGDRYRLLESRFRDVPERLSSLEASMTWSHDLCSPAEQLLWARLSVFVDGFEVEDVEEVCSGDGLDRNDVARLVECLVAKSIVTVEADADPRRWRLLDSIREYGATRLAEHDDPQRWAARHRDWCGSSAARLGGHPARPEGPGESPGRSPGLTPREHEVAVLVGAGLTNQQIASRLGISVRTVHGHMEKILRRLGFSSRAQVAAWIARRPDVGPAEVSPPASAS